MQPIDCQLPRLRWPSFFFAAVVCGVVLGSVWLARETPAELNGPKYDDHYIALTVSQLLQRDHLSKRPLDDTIAQRGLDTFVEMLDPLKIYFRQEDVDRFRQSRDRLDNLLIKGDISFAYTVFGRYLDRMDERIGKVDELLPMEHDYTLDEELVTDPDHASYVSTAEEADDLWRRRIKYELMVRRADDEDIDEARKNIARRYRNFAKRRHQTDSDELLEMYLTAMTSSYDPHTTYMSKDTLENFHINMRLNLEGIGAALQIKDGFTIVTKIIPGGAADKMGKLKHEDRIVSVGQGSDGQMEDVIDMKLSDVVKLIRGKAGTTVRLGVIPAAGSEKQIYTITRAKIELKDSEARGVTLEESGAADDKKLKIGVIDLPSFYMDMAAARRNLKEFKSTTRDVRRVLEDFKAQQVDAVVLDLRRNGGGSLTEAIRTTGLFIDEGPVVQVKDSANQVQPYNDDEKGMAWEGPLIVLISKFSASASEILAGAIQDYGRGIVIGDQATHGKGTVQSLLDLGSQLDRSLNPPKWGALKITMQQFYRPNGESTQKQGVISDIVLPSLTTHMDIGESDLDYAMEYGTVEPALTDRDKLKMVSPELLTQLRQRSRLRCAESEDFQKLSQNIERYIEQKKRTTVTLNEKEFLAERAEWDSKKEEEKELEDQFDTDRPVFDRDYYYNGEVLAITSDYLELLRNHDVAQVGQTAVGRTGG